MLDINEEGLVFGSWRGVALSWLPVDCSCGNVLLLAKNGIEVIPYRKDWDSWDDGKWEDSDLKAWLEGVFFVDAFTNDEKKIIAQLPTALRSTQATVLQDRGFDLKCCEAPYIPELEEPCWWLSDGDRSCLVVDREGRIENFFPLSYGLLARPAVWIKADEAGVLEELQAMIPANTVGGHCDIHGIDYSLDPFLAESGFGCPECEKHMTATVTLSCFRDTIVEYKGLVPEMKEAFAVLCSRYRNHIGNGSVFGLNMYSGSWMDEGGIKLYGHEVVCRPASIISSWHGEGKRGEMSKYDLKVNIEKLEEKAMKQAYAMLES